MTQIKQTNRYTINFNLVKLLLDNKLEIFAIYDSGSNFLFINFKLFQLKDRIMAYINNANFRMINGI